MPLRRATLAVLVFAPSFIAADCETPSGISEHCPGAVAQTVAYYASGSCGEPGTVVLSTQPGLCDISVDENTNVGLPPAGELPPGASTSDLTKGGFTMETPPSSNTMLVGTGGTSLNCPAGSPTPLGEITLTCAITSCQMVGEDTESTCGFAGTCIEHLMPAPDGSVPNFDGGATIAPMDAGSSGG